MTDNPSHALLTLVTQRLKPIPLVWPLQQFVATNPLWELIEYPIEEAVEKANHTTLTLPLETYWHYYQSGMIKENAITEAISIWLQQATITATHRSPLQPLLYQFMTTVAYQTALLQTLHTKCMPQTPPSTAILLSSQLQPLFPYHELLAYHQSECIDWLIHYFSPTKFDECLLARLSHPSSQPDNPNYPLFHFWRTLIPSKNRQWKKFLSAYPVSLEAFLQELLETLSIPPHQWGDYLFAVAWELKGFVGYMKWQQQYPDHPYCYRSAQPIEILAIWLAYEAFWCFKYPTPLTRFSPQYPPILPPTDPSPLEAIWQTVQQSLADDPGAPPLPCPVSETTLAHIWQHAYELSYLQPLYRHIQQQKQQHLDQPLPAPPRPKAQWILCIDVRSEGLRRHLEQIDHYQTFGYAGFFAFAHQLIDPRQQTHTFHSPPLFTPSLVATLTQPPPPALSTSLRHSLLKGKKSLLASFVLYEGIGFWYFFALLYRSYLKGRFNPRRLIALNTPQNHHPDDAQLPATLTVEAPPLDSLIESAAALLKGIGLTKHFAKIVVICGHHATTENNPYQAAFECGACGGNAGVTSARLASQWLNHKTVRAALADQHHITIPTDTYFIPACHNTTTDRIQWYRDPNLLLSTEHTTLLHTIKNDAQQAGQRLQAVRIKALPGDKSPFRRANHFAELIPEWGLGNNAAMVIGSRQLTQALNLEQRVFLQDYQAADDPEGEQLEAILLGPVVVAHWINSQYNFSSLAPHYFSSGNKAIHNVLPFVGVMEGNQSDLKYGLPLQSLFYQERRIHEPRRLGVLIDAPEERIQRIIQKHRHLHQLVNGRWLFIQALSAC